jgi:protein NirF
LPLLVGGLLFVLLAGCSLPRGTGDLGLVVERASGSLVLVNTSEQKRVAAIAGLGDLSHASMVFSRDERYAYVFGRDGGLTKVDLLRERIVARVIQGGNSIGGSISQDGKLIAVANYEPGGVKVFDAVTLELVADIPAEYAGGRSKVVGLADAPGRRFVFSLYEAGEIWVADLSDPAKPSIRQFKDVGRLPYDALLTPDGRYYIAGLFGEDGLVLLDLWNLDSGPKRILAGYGRGTQALPVYKMPHLRGWAMAGDYAFLPAVGHHEVLVVDRRTWKEVAHIPVNGQPVFVMGRPDGRHVWVSFAYPNNESVQVIDTATLKVVKTLTPGKAVLHMEFTPRGEQIWISSRDEHVVKVYDTATFEEVAALPAASPSGIFFSARAHRIGL